MSAVAAEADASIDLRADQRRLRALIAAIESVFHGKREAVELTLTALLAQGHVLFEDVPGVGKTTLARTVARALDASFKRIQFTSDLLPADVLGVNLFNRKTGAFEFKRGPIFANVVLADEINRTTPRSQSALLEAMNVGQVTVDEVTYQLPRPFVVMATQNPLEFAGTYPLPESQLDRFALRISIGYPDAATEQDVIRSLGFGEVAESLEPVLGSDELLAMQGRVKQVEVSEPVLAYLHALIAETRKSPYLSVGVSTRGAISLFRAAQARAWIAGRDYALPDDVQALFACVCAHRVRLASASREATADRRGEAETVLGEILDATPVKL